MMLDRAALMGEAQRSIALAVEALDRLGQHPLLDEATRILGQAQDKLALFTQEGTAPPPVGLLFWMETKSSPDCGFEDFWKAWPYKRNKKKAKLAWLRLKPGPALVETILAAVEADKRTDQWQRGIIPHASTWINGRRWEDERSPEIGGKHQGCGRYCADPRKYEAASTGITVRGCAQPTLFPEQTTESLAGAGTPAGIGSPTGGW